MRGDLTVQIFVKMDGSRTIAMDVADDQVSDMMKRIPNGGDMYVTSGRRVLSRSEKLRSCGVSAGCMIRVTSRTRRRKTQGQEEQSGEETSHETGAVSDMGPARRTQ